MPNETNGAIDSYQIYTLTEFKRRTGQGDAGMRAMRRQGLKTVTVGKRKYVCGGDFFDFLKSKEVQDK